MIDNIKRNDEYWKRFIRDEEYNPVILDKYGRFPYYASRERDILKPSVSKYLIGEGLAFEYPHQEPFGVCLTHDIDVLMTGTRSKIARIGFDMFKRRPDEALDVSKSLKSRDLPLNNIKKIMDLEEEYNAKSTFFYMALQPGELDFNYRIEEVNDDLGNIIDRGWEVGLHGGHGAYNDYDRLMVEKKRLECVLGKSVNGYRNHFLRFKTPETWEILSKAGFKYDSTLGYADMVGFRNGMCHPFKPFNKTSGRVINLIEIPLIVMDGTLNSGYMRLDIASSWELIHQLISEVEACHGIFTVLWHNTFMIGDQLMLYKKILKHCKEKGAWIACGSEIARWCNNV